MSVPQTWVLGTQTWMLSTQRLVLGAETWVLGTQTCMLGRQGWVLGRLLMGLGRTYEERKGYVRGSQEVRGGEGWRAPCAVMAFGKVYTQCNARHKTKRKLIKQEC